MNARFAKPLDENLLHQHAQKCGVIVTLEDHVLPGGFGSAVLEFLQANDLRIPVTRIGWPDAFVDHADSVSDLREANGLSQEDIYKKVLDHFQTASPSERSLAFLE